MQSSPLRRRLGSSFGSVMVTILGLAAVPCLGHAQAAKSDKANDTTEVVITAQKRTEKLSSVPVAASVLSTASLTKSNATDISDLNKIVPSVQVNGTINGRVPMGVRGISSVSNEGTVGIASGVEVLVDGVPIPSDSMAGNALEDVSRIEVLKGPQSTLGGRTASAGEINVVTYGPTSRLTGGITATVTDDDEQHLIAHVSGPLTDQLSYSLAGWTHHVEFPIENIQTGKYTNSDTSGGRLKLLYKPTNDLDIALAVHTGTMESHGSNFVYTYLTPGANLLCGLSCPPVGVGPGTFTQSYINAGITPSQTNLKYTSPVTNAGATVHDTDAALTVDYHLGDYILSSTTAYQRETQTNVQDLFAVGHYFFQDLCGCNVFMDTQTQKEWISQTSEEVKFLSPADRQLTYLVGVFYSDTLVHESQLRTLPPAAEDLDITPETQTLDFYGRATFKLTDAFKVVAGMRYNLDKLSDTEYQAAFAQTSPQSCQAHPVTDPATTVPCYMITSNRSDALVGDLSLQYTISPNAMAYVSYARGYSPKAYNTALALLNDPVVSGPSVVGPQGLTYLPADTLTPVDQEHIDNYEAGLKGTFFDRKLSLDVALFDTKYTNYQIQSFSSTPGVLNPELLLLAAGGAETKGLEVNGSWRATHLTNIGFNVAFIDAKFTNYNDAPCWVGETAAEGCDQSSQTQNVTGKLMPNSPKMKYTLTIDQTIPTSLPWTIVADASYAYRSTAQMLVDQNPEAIQKGFGLLNLSVSATSPDGTYTLAAFVNNVTDHRYYTDVEDFWSGPWASNAVIGQAARDARTYGGIRLEVKY